MKGTRTIYAPRQSFSFVHERRVHLELQTCSAESLTNIAPGCKESYISGLVHCSPRSSSRAQTRLPRKAHCICWITHGFMSHEQASVNDTTRHKKVTDWKHHIRYEVNGRWCPVGTIHKTYERGPLNNVTQNLKKTKDS